MDYILDDIISTVSECKNGSIDTIELIENVMELIESLQDSCEKLASEKQICLKCNAIRK